MLHPRGPDQVVCVPTGVQPCEDRYSKRRRLIATLPRISAWRCNLTALSHTHNLYFVAHGPHVYVYIPHFPTQRLREDPVLIVSLQSPDPGRPGYLSPSEPQDINNILVQHLGSDEIVATVRDNGDVDAVLVRHIVQAIDRRAEPSNTLDREADEIRPIFQSNVGMSAWGLAIHTDARILATSSNLHEVRIFKFGLLEDDTTAADLAGGVPVHAGGERHSCRDRQLDVTQRIINGNANIPHIAFCNTGDDPQARWLLTTDINGNCRTLDLHASPNPDITANGFRFAPQREMGSFDRQHAGWGIMFLDRRSFVSHKSWADACRLPFDRPVNQDFVDISGAITSVPHSSRTFRFSHGSSTRASDLGSTLGEHGSLASPIATRAPADALLPSTNNAQANDISIGSISPSLASDNDDDEAPYEMTMSDEYVSDYYDFDEGSDEELDDGGSSDESRASRPLLSSFNSNAGPTVLCEGLPCPILHTSVKNIYLLQPADPTRPGIPTTAPMITLQDPLRQAVQAEWGYLHVFNRLNMHAYIPEIGIVVVASQKGRAAIISLVKAPRTPGRHQRVGDMCYGMRLEYILPFDTQENRNQRPPFPLHGIAVGPVQGTESLSPDHKRWRLLMMYHDHSVMSYEIRRTSTGCDTNIDIDSLVI